MSETKAAILPPNCHKVSVEGVGEFVFRRRTMRLQGEIERQMVGVGDPGLLAVLQALNDLTVLTVAAPSGWDLDDPDEFDPLEPSSVVKILLVHSRLKEEEKKIREARGEKRQSAGTGA